VAGVLVEKAKTTPDSYPMTLNAIRNACNQKSNRFPQMQLDEDDVQEALDRLRHLGVVTEIFSDGRVPKYRHKLYEWLGVAKVELAVMAELLLRGAQTIGELRGRAARMEPIGGLSELQPVLDALEQRGLVLYLTPKGRGCVVTHALYGEKELERLRREHAGGASSTAAPPSTASSPASASSPESPKAPTPPAAVEEPSAVEREIAALRREVEDLRQQTAEISQHQSRLRSELDEIKRQLGI